MNLLSKDYMCKKYMFANSWRDTFFTRLSEELVGRSVSVETHRLTLVDRTVLHKVPHILRNAVVLYGALLTNDLFKPQELHLPQKVLIFEFVKRLLDVC